MLASGTNIAAPLVLLALGGCQKHLLTSEGTDRRERCPSQYSAVSKRFLRVTPRSDASSVAQKQPHRYKALENGTTDVWLTSEPQLPPPTDFSACLHRSHVVKGELQAGIWG